MQGAGCTTYCTSQYAHTEGVVRGAFVEVGVVRVSVKLHVAQPLLQQQPRRVRLVLLVLPPLRQLLVRRRRWQRCRCGRQRHVVVRIGGLLSVVYVACLMCVANFKTFYVNFTEGRGSMDIYEGEHVARKHLNKYFYNIALCSPAPVARASRGSTAAPCSPRPGS